MGVVLTVTVDISILVGSACLSGAHNPTGVLSPLLLNFCVPANYSFNEIKMTACPLSRITSRPLRARKATLNLTPLPHERRQDVLKPQFGSLKPASSRTGESCRTLTQRRAAGSPL